MRQKGGAMKQFIKDAAIAIGQFLFLAAMFTVIVIGCAVM